VVTADMVGFQPMGLPEAVATGAFGEGSEDEVLGSVAIGPVGAGELLQRSSVRAAGTVDRSPYEVSFQIDAARALNGALRPGERVDVIATTGVGSTAVTERILDDAIVIGVGAPPSASLVTSDVVVTVALDDADAVLRLSTAADTGQLTLVRRVGS
jgi:Flp pilus assembly protein CpaB